TLMQNCCADEVILGRARRCLGDHCRGCKRCAGDLEAIKFRARFREGECTYRAAAIPLCAGEQREYSEVFVVATRQQSTDRDSATRSNGESSRLKVTPESKLNPSRAAVCWSCNSHSGVQIVIP